MRRTLQVEKEWKFEVEPARDATYAPREETVKAEARLEAEKGRAPKFTATTYCLFGTIPAEATGKAIVALNEAASWALDQEAGLRAQWVS